MAVNMDRERFAMLATVRIRSAFGLSSWLSFFVVLGCGSQPVPLVAVEGTSAFIAIPGTFPTGFGRALYGSGEPPMPADLNNPPPFNANSPLEDPQRGEMVFDLYDGPTFLANLPLRWIARAHPSPSSRSAVDPALDGVFYQRGQAIAVVDIPLGVIPEDKEYRIEVRRYRRVKGAPNNYELAATPTTSSPQSLAWRGWGEEGVPPVTASSPAEIPIYIQTRSTAPGFPTGTKFTELWGFMDIAGVGLAWARQDPDPLMPHPEFELRVPEIGSGQTPPAAWEIELAYPRSNIAIRGVSLRRAAPAGQTSGTLISRQGAVVQWETDDPDASFPCFEVGNLNIKVIDPEQQTEGVRVAYSLRKFNSACAIRASAAAFVETDFVAYDLDGNDVTGSYAAQVDPGSFF